MSTPEPMDPIDECVRLSRELARLSDDYNGMLEEAVAVEKERNALKAELAAAQGEVKSFRTSLTEFSVEHREYVAKTDAELAALREDKARLDWLLANCSSFVAEDFTTGNRDLYNIDATTEAIDKVIAERKEKKL